MKSGIQVVILQEKGPEQLLPRPVKTPKTLLTNLMKTHVQRRISRFVLFWTMAWILLFLEVQRSEFRFHKQH